MGTHGVAQYEPSLKSGVAGALKLSEWLGNRRESRALSGRNVPAILEAVLSHGAWQRSGAGGRVPTVTREECLAAKV